MRTKIDYDINNKPYSYISYEEKENTFKPRYTLTNTINFLGEESFLFKKDNNPYMAYTIFDKARRYESETFSQIYFLTYNDLLKRKTGKEEICFIPVNELTERYLKKESTLNLFKELKVEKDYFNNYKTVVPLLDANDSLIKNKQSQRQKTVFKGIALYNPKSYDFSSNTPRDNLYKLIEINLRCRANLKPYDPLQYMNKKELKEIVDYMRMNPDQLWKAWTHTCKKIDLENLEYHKQEIIKYKERNSNPLNRIKEEVKELWHTKKR